MPNQFTKKNPVATTTGVVQTGVFANANSTKKPVVKKPIAPKLAVTNVNTEKKDVVAPVNGARPEPTTRQIQYKMHQYFCN